jgi:hypothetical protein
MNHIKSIMFGILMLNTPAFGSSPSSHNPLKKQRVDEPHKSSSLTPPLSQRDRNLIAAHRYFEDQRATKLASSSSSSSSLSAYPGLPSRQASQDKSADQIVTEPKSKFDTEMTKKVQELIRKSDSTPEQLNALLQEAKALDKNPNLNAQFALTKWGPMITPLAFIIQRSNPQAPAIVRTLLLNGADQAKDNGLRHGYLPIHEAASFFKPGCLSVLLEDNPNMINAITAEGATPLWFATLINEITNPGTNDEERAAYDNKMGKRKEIIDLLIKTGLPIPSLNEAIASTKNKDLLEHLNLRRNEIHTRIKGIQLTIRETHHFWPPGLAEIIAHYDRTLPLPQEPTKP